MQDKYSTYTATIGLVSEVLFRFIVFSNIFNYSYKSFKWIIYFLVVYKQRLKHLQGFENLAGARFIAYTMRFENDTSQLAPGGVASFAAGVRQ